MFNNLHKVNSLLTRRQRWTVVGLFGLMLLVGIFQVGAVTSIMPFMAVVADPEIIERNRWLGMLYEAGNFETTRGFLFLLGGLVLGAIVLTNLVMILSHWLNLRFTWNLNARLSRDLLARYLSRPYVWYLNRNSSDLGKNVLGEVAQFIGGYLQPLILLFSKGVNAIALIALIVAVDVKVAMTATIFLGVAYGTLYMVLRKKLSRIGKKRVDANRERFQSVQEAFGSIKETKVLQRESFFVQDYDRATSRYSRYMALHGILGMVPKHILEIIAFGGMVILVLYFLATRDSFAQVMPVLALYAFAGYRLMPTLQACFKALGTLRFSQAVLDLLYNDYHRETAEFAAADSQSAAAANETYKKDRKKLPFRERIEVENVGFSYPGTDHPALRDVSLEIPYGRLVAFCGTTGSGKTTLADIILGLLQPGSGVIRVDGTPVTNANRREWMRNIGYVPQSIHLSDCSVAGNIALGIPEKRIDREAVAEAARLAQIHEFIVNEMPQGYDTVVGERGVRISGGQRQRLGIARALYHRPDLIVFDEATSALDGITEKRLIEAIQEMAGIKTVIMIAHRLTTVKNCDEIFLLEHGELMARGPYDTLMKENLQFRGMANVS